MIDNFINILLIFPLVAGVLMLFIRKKAFDNFTYCFVLFVLFCLVLFVLSCLVLFCFVLLCFALLCFVLFCLRQGFSV